MKDQDEAFAEDLAKLEKELARMTNDVRAADMTPAEIEAELESGKVTVRGLLAGIYFAGGPGRC